MDGERRVDLLDAICATDDRAQAAFIGCLSRASLKALRLVSRRAGAVVDNYVSHLSVAADVRGTLLPRLQLVQRRWPRCSRLSVRGEPASVWQQLGAAAAQGACLPGVRTLRIRVAAPQWRYRVTSSLEHAASSDLSDFYDDVTGALAEQLAQQRLEDGSGEEGASGEAATSGSQQGSGVLTEESIRSCVALAPNLLHLTLEGYMRRAAVQGERGIYAALGPLERLSIPAHMYDSSVQHLQHLQQLDLLASKTQPHAPPLGLAPQLSLLSNLSVLTLEGMGVLPDVTTPQQLRACVPAGLRRLLLLDRVISLPQLVEWPPLPRWRSGGVRYRGDAELDFEAGTLAVGKVSLEELAGLIHGIKQVLPLRRAVVGEVDLQPGSDCCMSVDGLDSRLSQQDVAFLEVLGAFAGELELEVKAAMAGYKAGAQLLLFLKHVSRVRRLCLHSHGSNNARQLWALMHQLGKQLPAERLPEQLQVSGYMHSGCMLSDGLSEWPRLRSMVATVNLEQRPAQPPQNLRGSRHGGARPRRPRPPVPKEYADVVVAMMTRVQPDGWCAVSCRSGGRFQEELVAALAGEPFLVSAVSEAGAVMAWKPQKWVCAAASPHALQAACKGVWEFSW